MPAFFFKCPNTSMRVQHWLDDDPDSDDREHEALTGPACDKVHFINPKTGKLFNEESGRLSGGRFAFVQIGWNLFIKFEFLNQALDFLDADIAHDEPEAGILRQDM